MHFKAEIHPMSLRLSTLICDKSFVHPGTFSAGFVIKLRGKGNTTRANQDTWATKLFTVAPDVCGFSVWQSFHFAYLAPNISRWPAEREAYNSQPACDAIFLLPLHHSHAAMECREAIFIVILTYRHSTHTRYHFSVF